MLNFFDEQSGITGLGEDEQTGSQGVTTPLPLRRVAGGEAWYSLDGRRLEGKPSQRGIYVNNGRKIVIK